MAETPCFSGTTPSRNRGMGVFIVPGEPRLGLVEGRSFDSSADRSTSSDQEVDYVVAGASIPPAGMPRRRIDFLQADNVRRAAVL